MIRHALVQCLYTTFRASSGVELSLVPLGGRWREIYDKQRSDLKVLPAEALDRRPVLIGLAALVCAGADGSSKLTPDLRFALWVGKCGALTNTDLHSMVDEEDRPLAVTGDLQFIVAASCARLRSECCQEN